MQKVQIHATASARGQLLLCRDTGRMMAGMKLERRLTAAQLAAMSIAGSLLLYAGVWQAALPYHQHFNRYYALGDLLWVARFEIVRYVLPLVLGSWMMYGGLAAFRRGVEDTIWSESSLAKLRIQINRGVWNVTGYLLSAALLGYILFDLVVRHVGPHHGGSPTAGLTYFFVAPLFCLGMLRNALRPKRTEDAGTWFRDMKPLVSEHWGEHSPTQQIS
jgi:hypothetical protein